MNVGEERDVLGDRDAGELHPAASMTERRYSLFHTAGEASRRGSNGSYSDSDNSADTSFTLPRPELIEDVVVGDDEIGLAARWRPDASPRAPAA